MVEVKKEKNKLKRVKNETDGWLLRNGNNKGRDAVNKKPKER